MNGIKQTILKHIRLNDFTTYAKIQSLFDEAGHDYKGDYTFFLEDNNTSWGGWSYEAYRMIEELQEDGFIVMQETEAIFYGVDRVLPVYPLGTIGKRYKRLHWTPVCFRPVPTPAQDEDEGFERFITACDVLLMMKGVWRQRDEQKPRRA